MSVINSRKVAVKPLDYSGYRRRRFWESMLGIATSAWAWLPFLAGAVVGGFAIWEAALSVLPFYLSMFCVGILALRISSGSTNWKDYGKVFAAAFAFRVIMAVGFHLLFLHRDGVPFQDATYYGQQITVGSRYYSWGILASRLPFWDYGAVGGVGSSRYYGYIYTLGLVHRFSALFGDANVLNPRILSSFADAMTSVLIVVWAKRFEMTRKAALAAGYLFGIYPVSIFVAAQIERDPLVALLVLLNVLTFENLRTGRFPSLFFGLQLVLLLALTELRFESFLPMVIVLVGALILGAHQGTNRLRLSRAFTFVLTAVALITLLRGSYPARSVDQLLERATIGYTEYILEHNVSETQSVARLLLTFPPPFSQMARLVYNLVLPVPIIVLGGKLEVAFKNMGAILWYPLIPFAVLSVFQGLKDPRKATCAFAVLVYFAGVALSSLNDRHSMQYVPLFMLFGVDGVLRYRQHFTKSLVTEAYLLGWAFVFYRAYKLQLF